MKLTTPVLKFMTKNPSTVHKNDTILSLKHLYEQKKFHHHVPVVDHDQLIGIVSLIDFMRVVQNASLDDDDDIYSKFKVKDIMSEKPICVSESASLEDVTDIFLRNEFHALPVTENNKLKGIVTTTDLLRYYKENA